ncbi:hypothetical protein Sjap_001691 [Stephania japonica]|uniref:Uncharacterized protein n=1 Tax=Stephania japonica TaxID=461633 RepID=A0AAP0PVA5_9MAGN
MRMYCNHEEEAATISDEEMVDGDANIDDEEMVDANFDDEDEDMVDANIDDDEDEDEEMIDANIDDEDKEMVDANIDDKEMVNFEVWDGEVMIEKAGGFRESMSLLFCTLTYKKACSTRISLKTQELYAMVLLAWYLDLCGGHRAISHGIGLKVQPKQDDLLQVVRCFLDRFLIVMSLLKANKKFSMIGICTQVKPEMAIHPSDVKPFGNVETHMGGLRPRSPSECLTVAGQWV